MDSQQNFHNAHTQEQTAPVQSAQIASPVAALRNGFSPDSTTIDNLPTYGPWASLWKLRRNAVQLDHASFGGCPQKVMTAQDDVRYLIESDVYGFIERDYTLALRRSKETLAIFLNADLGGLSLLPGVTHALNVIIQSQSFEPGDELLTISHAYSSTLMILKHVAKRDQAKVVVANVPFPVTSPDEVLETLLACVTVRTRFAVIDHVTSRTSLILPVEQMVGQLSARGVDTLVDGAHAPGAIEVDLDRINAAYYVGDCHKWMCTPRGSGFMHIRRDRLSDIKPLIVARSAYENEPAKISDLERHFDWLGTADPSACLSVPAAISFLDTTIPGGRYAYAGRNHELAVVARKLLCEAFGIAEPCPEHMIGSMASIRLPDPIGPRVEARHLPLQQTLWNKYRIEIPIYSWPSYPKRVLRFSVQAHNHVDQYIYLAKALKATLAEERKARI